MVLTLLGIFMKKNPTEPKKRTMKTKTKQTTRTGTESEKWISHGGFSVGRERGGIAGERYRE